MHTLSSDPPNSTSLSYKAQNRPYGTRITMPLAKYQTRILTNNIWTYKCKTLMLYRSTNRNYPNVRVSTKYASIKEMAQSDVCSLSNYPNTLASRPSNRNRPTSPVSSTWTFIICSHSPNYNYSTPNYTTDSLSLSPLHPNLNLFLSNNSMPMPEVHV